MMERCLSLLLEFQWIATMARHPLRGERQPLPADSEVQSRLYKTVHALNQASGDAAGT